MTIDINCSINDLSYIRVLFIKTSSTDLGFFKKYSRKTRDEITYFSKNTNELVDEQLIHNFLPQDVSNYETKNLSLRFTFKYLFINNILKNDFSKNRPFFSNVNILIIINGENNLNSYDYQYLESLNKINREFSFTYGINLFKKKIPDSKLDIKWYDVDINLLFSIKEIVKQILMDLITRLNSIVGYKIEEISNELSCNKEVSEKESLLNIKRRRQIAEIYLILGFAIPSAMYYNLAVEYMGEINSNFLTEFISCIEGQIAVLYFYYFYSGFPTEWWEVVSNSLNSFTQELPAPLQIFFQPIHSNIFNNTDPVFTTQSRKSLLFDFILKKFSLILNLLAKTNHFYNGLITFDVQSPLTHTDELAILMYELILKKARFLLDNVVTHYNFNRKLIVDFLDPYISSIYQLSFFVPKNCIYNYSIFLLGCAQVFQLVKSNRRVGLILIRLSQLFIKHKLFEISYNISCTAYEWYTSIYCNTNKDNCKIIESLASLISLKDEDSSKHVQCEVCNISSNSNIIIGDHYSSILNIDSNIQELLDECYISNKQYLNNNYIQYLSIYKHDLTLKYSVFLSTESFNSFESEVYSNIHEELLTYLKPFINSSICYGIHSMLQTYRKYNINIKRKPLPTVYPCRYEMLSLVLMLESCILLGCPSRSVSVLAIILEKMVYFPPIYDLEAFKTIQSKCIDNLSILSSTIQFPLIRAPYYSITVNKYRGFTSIESMDITKFNSVRYTTHLLLLFNITCEAASINAKACSRCTNSITRRSIFNKDNHNHCSDCECLINYIEDSPWMVYQISNSNYCFESQFISGQEMKWSSLQEKNCNNIKLPILSRYTKMSQNSNLFLYNPYEKKFDKAHDKYVDNKGLLEFQTASVLWQVNKQYTVHVSLFNPFVVPLILDCFNLIISGEVSCEICPVSVVVPPTPRFSVPGGEVKIALNVIPKNSGSFSIIGVTYKFSGINYVNFGFKSSYTNNKNSLRAYLDVFVTPKILSEIDVSWKKVEGLTVNKENADNKIVEGKITIRASYRFENETDNYILTLLNTDVLVDKLEKSTVINNIMLSSITYEENSSIATLECFEIYKIKKIKLLYKARFKYNGKVIISSSTIDIVSRNPPYPKITDVSLIPKLLHSPIKNYIGRTKWEVDKIWLILTIENNSKVFPIEFSFPSIHLNNNKITLPPDVKGYRWVIDTSLTCIEKLNRNSELILLLWKAYFPHSIIDEDLCKVAETGNLYFQNKIPEFLSNYEFKFEIECNGVNTHNNSILPIYSLVNIRIYVKSKEQVIGKNILVKVIPMGDTSKSKQIYLDHSENHVSNNSNIPNFSFSIIGLEKKTFEWIVGVEELEAKTQEKILHWKSDLLSISFS